MPAPKRDVIVIAASAGGVQALCDLVGCLPKNLKASVFVVMHVGAESQLEVVLSRCGRFPVVQAQHNKPFQTGCLYVAPPNCHLAIKQHRIVLTRGARENGHRPAADVLFRSAAREQRSKVVGVVLSGGRDDGAAGLFAIKARGGVAIVQDPMEAITPDMPRNALRMVDVDYCLPVRQIARILVHLTAGKATSAAEGSNVGTQIEDSPNIGGEIHTPPGEQIPVSCPECNGPLFQLKAGQMTHFQCVVGHAYSPAALSDEHTEALERALWMAIRKLKERALLHRHLLERKTRNKGEEQLRARLEESAATAERDLELLRDIIDRL